MADGLEMALRARAGERARGYHSHPAIVAGWWGPGWISNPRVGVVADLSIQPYRVGFFRCDGAGLQHGFSTHGGEK